MEKFETGGFPTGKELFIQTDVELYGSFGNKKLFPYQPLPILGEVRKAVEKSLLIQNVDIEVQYGKENPISNAFNQFYPQSSKRIGEIP